MILGDTCTRRCGFCNVKTGRPTWNDPLEPARVARSIARMGLRHAVITSVDRDDLPDKGAAAFVAVIGQVRRQAPGCKVEVLTPDFQGQEMPLAKVIAARPDVFNHNVEVVPRLYPLARRGSDFERSCRVLRLAREMGGDELVTKSGVMVGLGESHEELVQTFAALRASAVIAVALVLINVLAYLLSIRHGGSLLGGPTNGTAVHYGAIPYELTHPGDHCDLVQVSTLEGSASSVACQGQPGVTGTPPSQPSTWETVFTAMFLHGGILHIAGNMLFLAIFGPNVA